MSYPEYIGFWAQTKNLFPEMCLWCRSLTLRHAWRSWVLLMPGPLATGQEDLRMIEFLHLCGPTSVLTGVTSAIGVQGQMRISAGSYLSRFWEHTFALLYTGFTTSRRRRCLLNHLPRCRNYTLVIATTIPIRHAISMSFHRRGPASDLLEALTGIVCRTRPVAGIQPLPRRSKETQISRFS